MKQCMTIYHGSHQIVERPMYGFGKEYNDYGQGFYCTEDIELAKEWACPLEKDGYVSMYSLDLDGLKVMHLTEGDFNILNWLAILLEHRKFDISSPIASQAREFIIDRFSPDTNNADVMIGYRADDSYFAFAEDFISNTISLRDLNRAMHLSNLGEQVVLISERSFQQIEYVGYEIADYREYSRKRVERDRTARADYRGKRTNAKDLLEELFILDIIREDMRYDDPRLRSALS